jgi:hypothetical protein
MSAIDMPRCAGRPAANLFQTRTGLPGTAGNVRNQRAPVEIVPVREMRAACINHVAAGGCAS